MRSGLVAEHAYLAPCYVDGLRYPSDVDDHDLAVIRAEAWLRHPQIKNIFLDVDEVLADWLGATFNLLGIERVEADAKWSAMDPRPWDVFTALGVSGNAMWRAIDNAGAKFWADVEPFAHARQLLQVCNEFAPTTLLTSPSKHPSSYAGKAEWIAKHFPGQSHLIGSCKERCASPTALLIDDRAESCEKFREHGGHAILFPGCGNSLHGMPDYERVDYVRASLEHFRR